jgi:hypothetical protein
VAEIIAFWSFLPLFLEVPPENDGAMEIFGLIIVILLLLILAATFSALLRDGGGHTPPVSSHHEWSALDLPSSSYTLRIF